jgi:6-pyruvoyltetrahydropterin/6-carboxytetrahydropterin synthase
VLAIYNGHPLYLLLGDNTPNATTGQGVKAFGVALFAVSPSGSAVTGRSTAGRSNGYSEPGGAFGRLFRSMFPEAETPAGCMRNVAELAATVSSADPVHARRTSLEVPVTYRELDDVRAAVAEREAATTVLVSRRETFNAAHQLRDPDLSEAENRRLYGKCANLHGHNYVLEVVVSGEIDPATGYILDLKQLSHVISRRIIEDVDHRNLNADVVWLEGIIPTAENLAVAFWERLRSELPAGSLRAVRLWETDKNWAEVGERA